MWVPDISKAEGPRYVALAKAINEAIDSGELPPGAQLPPQRDLALRLGVTVGTVGRAYKIVKARRLVTGEVGRGTFVRGGSGDGETSPSFLPVLKPGTMDFALFSSNNQGLVDALYTAFSEAAGSVSHLSMNRYPPAAGFPTHRTAGATWIGRSGYEAVPDNVIVCNGAQQAIMTILLALGDNENSEILCEQLSYSGIKALASMLGRKLRGVEIDSHGLVPKALEAALDESGSRLLYMQPTVHNPTGSVMPMARRREIAEIARRRSVVIIEDDTAIGGLRDRPAPIISLLPEQTVYITGLDKCISPALRVAYIASARQNYDRIVNTMHAMTLANPPIQAEAAAYLINSGAADRLANAQYEKLAAIHKAVSERLGNIPHHSHPAAFFLWIELPDHWTAREFCNFASQVGISVVPADNHTASGTPPAAIRITLSPTQRIDAIVDGIDKLVRLFSERVTPTLTV